MGGQSDRRTGPRRKARVNGDRGTRRPVTVAHFRVFERGPGGGNPCPVVVDAAGLSATDMLRLAEHFGEESGFVSHDDDGSLRFRFFMPRREVPMCVHATVAATTALVAKGLVDRGGGLPVNVNTVSGRCRVHWDDRTPPRVTVEQRPPRFGVPADVAPQVERALGIGRGTVDAELPIRPVSVSAPKLIVPLRRADDVHRASPDYELLWQLCQDLETTGAYVFAPHPDEHAHHFVARQFPVGGGIREDAATGVAAGALAAYLAERAIDSTPTWTAIEIDQGDAMGCPCRLDAAAYAEAGAVARTTVTGSASFIGEEHLNVPAGDPSPR
jgi:trans-2,3-dihydro-3-hydroxyanthranilate isomerase